MLQSKQLLRGAIALVITGLFAYELYLLKTSPTVSGPYFEPLLQELSQTEIGALAIVVTSLGMTASAGRDVLYSGQPGSIEPDVYQYDPADDVRCVVVMGYAGSSEIQCRRGDQMLVVAASD